MVAVHIFVVASLLMLSEKFYLKGCENLVLPPRVSRNFIEQKVLVRVFDTPRKLQRRPHNRSAVLDLKN